MKRNYHFKQDEICWHEVEYLIQKKAEAVFAVYEIVRETKLKIFIGYFDSVIAAKNYLSRWKNDIQKSETNWYKLF